jgi:hypothetical protein
MVRTALLAVSLLSWPAASLAGAAAPSAWGAAGALSTPHAIAVHQGRVYVADFDQDRITVFDASGTVLASWGESGSEPGRLRGPAGLAVDEAGAVYVTDHYNHRIQKFGADGKWIAAWNAGAPEAAPLGITLDPGGRVIVTDVARGAVTVWSPTGAKLAEWGLEGGAETRMLEPWGVAASADGMVWVADHGHDRIVRFSAQGTPLGAWRAAAGRVTGPMALALSADGSVAVTDLSGLERFSPSGELVERWPAARADDEATIPAVAWLEGGMLVAESGGLGFAAMRPGAALAGLAASPLELLDITPTPSRGAVTARLAVPGSGTLAAEIYSVDGRRVQSLPPRSCQAGQQTLRWDARLENGAQAPAGVYFLDVRFAGGGLRLTRRGRIVMAP